MKHVAKKHRHCLTGVMASFTTNAHLDIDGLVIRQGKKKILFHFPPHTAKRVMQCAGLQAEVSVQYQEKAHLPKGPNTRQVKRELLTITQMANQAVVHINNIPPPDAVETRQVSTFTIERPVFSKGKQGELTGIGDQDRFFHLLPKETAAIRRQLLTQVPIRLKAVKRRSRLGFVQVHGQVVYHVRTVEINGTVYRLRPEA